MEKVCKSIGVFWGRIHANCGAAPRYQCGVLAANCLKQMPKPFSTSDDFTKDAVRHIETTLARSLFNCDESAAYAGTALAFRDRLVLDWNKTQQSQTFADQKRVYCEWNQGPNVLLLVG